jgi:hypothetical protein
MKYKIQKFQNPASTIKRKNDALSSDILKSQEDILNNIKTK